MTRTLFVSDLHLASDRPEPNARFLRFLSEEAAGADALYILGDLFEYWIGDDALDSPEETGIPGGICEALRALTLRGTPVHVMHGNRDFLLGEHFCRSAGAVQLDDPTVMTLGGRRTLLMHGDTLCVDDRDYMTWRATARAEHWQREFLQRPLAERHRFVRELREQSRQMTKRKPAEIMDVNANAVAETVRHHDAQWLIHGHTHRPARHEFNVDGAPRERWVLPDWYGTGGYLAIEETVPRLVQFPA